MISQVLLFTKIIHCKFLVFLLIVFFFFLFFSSACEFQFIERIGADGKQNPDFIIIIIIILVILPPPPTSFSSGIQTQKRSQCACYVFPLKKIKKRERERVQGQPSVYILDQVTENSPATPILIITDRLSWFSLR